MSPETVAVLPTVDVKAQAPVSPVDADQTLSSSTASLSFYPASLNMKDRRAYERERQRAKKTAEYVVSRAQKEQNPTPPGTLSAPLRALWARTVSGRHREHVQVPQSQPRDSSGCSPGADSVPRKDLSSLFPSGDDVDSPRTRSSKPGSGRTSSMRSDSPKPEVALVDLINTTPRSPRKPRKGKVGDFELVPPVRSVIALDDHESRDFGESLTLNEPWEHVHLTGLGDELESSPEPEVVRRKAPSYAAVLTTK